MKKLSKNSLISLLSIVALLFLSVFIFSNNNFNLNSSASNKNKSLTGTLVLSSQYNCNSAYTYSIVSGFGDCTSIVINAIKVEGKIGQEVKLNGVLKDNVFYANKINVVSTTKVKPTVAPVESEPFDPEPIFMLRTKPSPKSTPVVILPPPRY